MSKLQKKKLLVEVGKPLIIRREPTTKHNEVTVSVIQYAIPMANITRVITPEVLKRVEKISVGYPSAGIRFNFNREAPAFMFTCKGKTERRGDDAPNQELADKIAIAKCRAKACVIGQRITTAIVDVFKEHAQHVEEISHFFAIHAEREFSYIRKV